MAMPDYVIAAMGGKQDETSGLPDYVKAAMTQTEAPTPSIEDGQRTLPKEIVRQLGLTGRHIVEGVTALPNMVGDALGLQSSKAISDLLTRVGLPQTENSQERVVGDISRAVFGAAVPLGVGSQMVKAAAPAVKNIGTILSTAPGMQTASAAMGGGAGGVVRESGGSPTAQLAASLAAGLTPSAAAYGAKQLPKSLLAGKDGQQNIIKNVKIFKEAGVAPSVGQTTEKRLPRAFESFLSKTPGAAGRMTKKAETEAMAIGNRVEELASAIAPKSSATLAGKAVEEGISGPHGFINQFRLKQRQLYNALDRFIPKDTEVPVLNTEDALQRLSHPIVGAEETSKILANQKILQVWEALKKDLRKQGIKGTDKLLTQQEPQKVLPYEAIKQLRTKIGDLLASNELLTDIPRSQLKQVYAAISEDMKAATALSSNPKQALISWGRANSYTKAGHSRVDNILQTVINKGDPEKIFQAAISGTREGATTFRGVMQSLPQESKKILAATMTRRMGHALPGKQNEMGEIFSTETFLTNWNKLAPEAKQVLFGTQAPSYKNSMEQIAKIANNIREGSKVFANPSGTQPALSNQATVGGAILSLLMGHPGATAGIAGAAGTANLSARLMLNPKFVNWLATEARKPIELLPISLNMLSMNNPEIASDLREVLSQSKGEKRTSNDISTLSDDELMAIIRRPK